MRLTRISIERFKRLERVDFDVSDVNILIGGNNSGKSTIIQAVHFGFTILQSLDVAKKWPVKAKKSSTISPTELIYIPSEDPYSLGYGGRLLEDEDKSIIIRLGFNNGEQLSLSVRKGRITNIIVEPDNVDFARTLSSLEAPYSIFSPGLAGVARTEQLLSDGVLLRAIARGDANSFLRNILYRLHKKTEWVEFESDLSMVFPGIQIRVRFDHAVDQHIDVKIAEGTTEIPLDLAGTGLLQSIQILAYLHLFSPKLIILDEPDSHLHPNNQRLLCSLLSNLSSERNVQVLMTTHSRHVVDALYSSAKMLWVQNGAVVAAQAEDQIDILLELGALDIKERLAQDKYRAVILTEDAISQNLENLLANSGFNRAETGMLPYNGVTSVHLLKPLVRQIKELSKASIIVHRDRDYMDADEVEAWSKDIRAIGAEPFVTAGLDIESYFATDEYIMLIGKDIEHFDLLLVKDFVVSGEVDDIITSYVNGRVDIERKGGTIGKLDLGKLSAAAARKVQAHPIEFMKGKKKLSKQRRAFSEIYGRRYEINSLNGMPVDKELAALAAKFSRVAKR